MAFRKGIYIVPINRWYIERTVWLIAGMVLLVSTALALWVDPRWVLLIIATGTASVVVALTGFCVVGIIFTAWLQAALAGRTTSGPLVLMQTNAGTWTALLLAGGSNFLRPGDMGPVLGVSLPPFGTGKMVCAPRFSR